MFEKKFPPQREFGRKDTGGGGEDLGTVTKQLGEVMAQVKNFGEDIAKKMQAGGQVTEELKQKADEGLTQMNALKGLFDELKERQTELEQKSTRRGQEEPTEFKSAGQLIITAEAMKGFNSSSRNSVRVQMDRKALMNVPATVGAGVSAGNSLVPADRRPGIIAPPEHRLSMRDLLAPGQTGANSVEYAQETGFTNNAATVAEGAAKPYSNITFNLKTANIRTIAHLFKASRQLLDDAPALQSYIDARARYGLRLVEDRQFLMGDGTGQNLLGIMPQAIEFVAPIVIANATAIDRMRLALLQAVLAEFPSSGFVLNPIDWVGIELTKDNEGRYIIAQPVNGIGPRLWGLPVAETIAMPQNNFLAGAFDLGAQIFDRMDVEVLISTENDKDFENNLVSIRAEQRTGLAVYRPEAFVTGLVTPA
jgi:HK97 family phage major capsid protein